MTPSNLRWNLTPWLLLLCQITYFLMFSWLMLLWVIEKEFLSRNSIFDLKWPRCNILWRNTFCTQAYRSTKRLKEKKLVFRHFCTNYMLRKIWLYMSKISIFWRFLEFEIFFSILFSGVLFHLVVSDSRYHQCEVLAFRLTLNPPILNLVYFSRRFFSKIESVNSQRMWGWKYAQNVLSQL